MGSVVQRAQRRRFGGWPGQHTAHAAVVVTGTPVTSLPCVFPVCHWPHAEAAVVYHVVENGRVLPPLPRPRRPAD